MKSSLSPNNWSLSSEQLFKASEFANSLHNRAINMLMLKCPTTVLVWLQLYTLFHLNNSSVFLIQSIFQVLDCNCWASFVCLCVSDQDGAEPSANSVSAFNLLRLSHYTGRQEWLQKSQQLLTAFSDRLTTVPIALPEMVRALMAQHYTLKQVSLKLTHMIMKGNKFRHQKDLFCPMSSPLIEVFWVLHVGIRATGGF